jgi:uncharacterized membrane protein YcaP (DUF421 family)
VREAASTRQDATHSFIIVEANGPQDIIRSRLADYLSLVALARPAMNAAYDDATIMSISIFAIVAARAPRA